MSNVQAGDYAFITADVPKAQAWAINRVVQIEHQCQRAECPHAQCATVWCFVKALVGPQKQHFGCCEDRYLRRVEPLDEEGEEGRGRGNYDIDLRVMVPLQKGSGKRLLELLRAWRAKETS